MRNLLPFITVLCSPATAAADDYVLDKDHTYAFFKVMHMDRGKLTGVFRDVKGTMEIDGDKVRNIDVVISTDSVDTFNEARDAHLKSPDYFNAKRYPRMTFKSRKVRKTSDGNYEIEGDLSIHGKTKRVTASATRGSTGKDPFGGYRTGGNVSFEINRRDFGITHMPNELVGDVIKVDLYWEALEESSVDIYFSNLRKATGG